MNLLSKSGAIVGFLFIIIATIMSITYGFTFGNAIAMCFGVSIVALSLLFKKLNKSLKRIIIVLISLLIIYYAIVISIIIINQSNTANYKEDCVLVLGCGIRGETILPTLQSRLDKCIEYHKLNPNAIIILSGGQGPKEDITEAEAMKRYLIIKGISKDKIIKEEHSTNTKENFKYSIKIMDSIHTSNNYSITCITSNFHTYRAKEIAKNYNKTINHINADVKWYLLPSTYIREVLSITKYWIFK